MGPRKYLSEFGLHMYGTACALLQQDRLADLEGSPFTADEPPHIYLIGRRPRIALVPDSVEFQAELVTGEFSIQRGEHREKHRFTGLNQLGTNDLRFECPYPHTEYRVLNRAGVSLSAGKVAFLVAMMDADFWELLDLEILYVGQAYGEEGERAAPDRLKSHSTLQSIYYEATQRSPDQEIWISLWSFQPMLMASFDGTARALSATASEDKTHSDEVISSEVTEQQRINFTEAALIRYFQPQYNAHFKDTFPSPAHKTYSECYNLDLNLVSVELQTESLRCRFWSPSSPPKWTHVASFPLHSPQERRAMFDFSPSHKNL